MKEIDLPESFTFDVFIDLAPKYKPRLLDINLWPDDSLPEIFQSEALLFETQELNEINLEID